LRISRALAWPLLLLTLFTAGLLRQFHQGTPESPYVSPIVGSLLFAAILLLLLVGAREWRKGAVPGRGIRLGSLIPLLLMLLIEKWAAITLYPIVFEWLARPSSSRLQLDAQFRALAGAGLLLVCLLLFRLSVPAARWTWRRTRPARWPLAVLGSGLVLVGTYASLGAMAGLLGVELHLVWPHASRLLVWIVVGQAVLAFAEELYFRGLLLAESERLAPRLGLSAPAPRRWFALASTGTLFGMEHMSLASPWGETARQLTFTISLGLLLGMMVMISDNLPYAAGIHAWINWLLLGAAPHHADAAGRPVLPPGTYIGLALILAFVLAYCHGRWRAARRRQAA
jgi:membrane protease YdiL (CAAX protease family)